jgi:hypothetical protein
MEKIRSVLSRLFTPLKVAKGSTVRYMFPLAVGFAAVLGAQLISATDSSYIRLEIDKQAVANNELFSVEVFAYAHVPVNAVDVTLTFDGDKVTVEQVDRGQSVLTIWTEDPVVTNNSVVLRGGTFRRGFIGEHRIARIDLRATDTGSSQFNTEDVLLLAGDGQGTPVTTSETSDASVNLFVYDENTNPSDIAVEVAVGVISDIDGDGRVTLRDISAFMSDWASNNRLHDFNGDGRMTFRDFSIILANFFFQ